MIFIANRISCKVSTKPEKFVNFIEENFTEELCSKKSTYESTTNGKLSQITSETSPELSSKRDNEEESDNEVESDSFPVQWLAIIGFIIFIVLFVAIIVFLVFYFNKNKKFQTKRRYALKKSKQSEEKANDMISDAEEVGKQESQTFSVKEIDISKPIPLKSVDLSDSSVSLVNRPTDLKIN